MISKVFFFALLLIVIASFSCSRGGSENAGEVDQLAVEQNEKAYLNPRDDSWHLFLDDYWIRESKGVEVKLHRPEKHAGNPLIRGDQPWEQNPYCFGTVIYDAEDSVFKIWYMTYNHDLPLAERTFVLYAESPDCVHWKKPDLGVIAFRGSKHNNIVLTHYGYHDLYSPGVIKDFSDPDPSRRYKMIWWDFPLGEEEYRDDGMCVAFSPDGIHWNKYAGNPVLHANKTENSISDVMSVMQDRHTGKYIAYTKGWAAPWPAFRQIVRTESNDFINWSVPGVVLSHRFDKQDPQSYGMSVTRTGDMYVGMLHSYKKPGDETIDVQIAASRDGVHWTRVAYRESFIRTGPPGSWDSGMIFTAPFIHHGDKTLICYGGWDGAHNEKKRHSGIGLAVLRKNGFVSLDAGKNIGRVATYGIMNAAGPLFVNVRAGGGVLRAALLDETGAPLDGYAVEDCIPVCGDGVAQLIRWKDRDVLPAAGRPFSIRFELSNASLYGFYAGSAAKRAMP